MRLPIPEHEQEASVEAQQLYRNLAEHKHLMKCLVTQDHQVSETYRVQAHQTSSMTGQQPQSKVNAALHFLSFV